VKKRQRDGDMTSLPDFYASRLGGPDGAAAQNHGYLLKVDRRFLDPTSGCGLMLAQTPRYEPGNAFTDIMRRYDCREVFADRRAARILDEEEVLMRQFCFRVDEYGVALKQNFQAIYAPCGVLLALDPNLHAAYFLAEPESCLALRNYFRDALAGTLEQLGVAFRGPSSRLTPTGWRNLFELANNSDFRFYVPPVRSIAVMAMAASARWRYPGLYISVSLLNHEDACEVAGEVLKAITENARQRHFWTHADIDSNPTPQSEPTAKESIPRVLSA